MKHQEATWHLRWFKWPRQWCWMTSWYHSRHWRNAREEGWLGACKSWSNKFEFRKEIDKHGTFAGLPCKWDCWCDFSISWDLNDIRVVFPTWHGFLFECWNQEKASVPLKLWESNHTFFARGQCCDDVICWRVPTEFGADFNTLSFLNGRMSSHLTFFKDISSKSKSGLFSYRSAWNNWATVPGATGRVTKRRCLVARGVVEDDMGNMIFIVEQHVPNLRLYCKHLAWWVRCFMSKLMVVYERGLELDTCMISRSDVAGCKPSRVTWLCLNRVSNLEVFALRSTADGFLWALWDGGWETRNSIDGNPGNPFAYLHCCAFCL